MILVFRLILLVFINSLLKLNCLKVFFVSWLWKEVDFLWKVLFGIRMVCLLLNFDSVLMICRLLVIIVMLLKWFSNGIICSMVLLVLRIIELLLWMYCMVVLVICVFLWVLISVLWLIGGLVLFLLSIMLL